MMALIIFLIFVLIAAVVLLRLFRTKKTKNVGSNHYRAYRVRAKETESPRLRPNRYQRQTHNEPTLGYKHTVGTGEDEEERVEPPVQKMEPEASKSTDDPDVVLGLKERAKVLQEEVSPQPRQMTLKPSTLPPPIVTLHVMAATDLPYTGYELLQAILSVSMRYGKHQIFHRHQEKTGRGFNWNNAKTNEIAVKAFSPPDNKWTVVLRFPGG